MRGLTFDLFIRVSHVTRNMVKGNAQLANKRITTTKKKRVRIEIEPFNVEKRLSNFFSFLAF